MFCYSFLFSSLPAWGLSIVSSVFFQCCHSFFPISPVFFTFLSWPCFIIHFSIVLCAWMAPIPFLLHFFCTFPGSFASQVSDLFICLINVTSFLTLPLFFIMSLYSGSSLPLFIPFLFHPRGHFKLQQPDYLYFPRDPFTANTIPYMLAHRLSPAFWTA